MLTSIITSPNLAPNPGFEDDPEGQGPPGGWKQDLGTSYIVFDAGRKSKVLYLPGDTVQRRISSIDKFNIAPERVLYGRLLAKGDGNQLLGFGIHWEEPIVSGSYWSYFIPTNWKEDTKGQWVELKASFKVPPGDISKGHNGRVAIWNYGNGPVWIDDIYVGIIPFQEQPEITPEKPAINIAPIAVFTGGFIALLIMKRSFFR